eukprot:SAG11_NODE_4822_length_1754_cov_1.030816_3_plen_154_part_00
MPPEQEVQVSHNAMAASAKVKAPYYTKPKTTQEDAKNEKISAYFEAKLTTKIKESQVNTTDPSLQDWATRLLESKNRHGGVRFRCMQDIPDGREPMIHDEPLVIEDREGVLPWYFLYGRTRFTHNFESARESSISPLLIYVCDIERATFRYFM